MKPHLPVSLFRALVAAVVSFPIFVFGGFDDIPDDYSQIKVTNTSDVAGNQQKAAFIFNMRTATWNPAYTLFSDSSKSVIFTSWDSTARTNINMSGGNRILGVGDMTFVDLNDITLDSNNYGTKSKEHTAAMGGVLKAGNAILSTDTETEGELIGFDKSDSAITFDQNRNISLTRNSLSLSIAPDGNPMPMRMGYAMGAAAGAVNLNITNNKKISIENNSTTVDVSGDDKTSVAIGLGGALFGNDITITGNEDITIQGNRLRVTSVNDSVAHGGAVGSTNSITIANNSSVTFRNNGVYRKFKDGNETKEQYYLEGLSIMSDNQGLLSVSAGSTSSVTFYDRISVDCDVSINANYNNASGLEESALGNVVFSGKYVESDLTAFRGETLEPDEAPPSPEELEISYKSEAYGTTTLHHGNMVITDKAVYSTGAFVAEANGASTLILNKGTLISRTYNEIVANPANGSTTFGKGSQLHLQSTGNNLEATRVIFDGNNTITFDISALNITEAGLRITSQSDVTFSAGTVIHLNSETKIADGIYKLITMADTVRLEGWTSANVSVSSDSDLGFTATYANLRWKTENNTQTLYYYTTLPQLTDAIWNNNDGDRIWSTTAINWEQENQPYAFANGAAATFTDNAAGQIIIEGEIRPATVLVENSADGNYEWIASENGGKLAGEMTLTKRGSGELKISLANEYSGETLVEEGTLIAGHNRAFGSGDITVKGGHLNTDKYAVSNNVLVNSGQFSGSAYAGQLTVTGTATIGDNTTAKSVILKAATITGGSLTNTSITSQDSNIETLLTGKTNLTVIGNTNITGNHSTTGTFTVKNGMLSLNGSTTADFDLQGGSLNTTTPIILASGQEVKFNGGNIQGSLETSPNSSVSIPTTSSISGDFILNGGTITPGGPSTTLKIGGKLNIMSATTVDVNNYYKAENYVLMSAEVISEGLEMLTAVSDTRNVNVLEIIDNSLVLKVTENAATLYWKPGEAGIWAEKNSQEWDTDAEDTRFFNRDTVIFANGGTAEIVGEVKPSSLRVTGDDDVTFTGAGSIAGETTLVKDGNGTLILNATNTYEGGTVIDGGTIRARGEASFGSGKIELISGNLNLGDYAVANDVYATGGEVSAATEYKGKLTVDGNIRVDDNTTAEEIVLMSGSIDGGSIEDAAITSIGSAHITSNLKQSTSVTVEDGETILSGRNSHTGDTTVNAGLLVIERAESLGNGNIYLNGGHLQAKEGITLALSGKQALHFSGGNYTGSIRTANATSIVVNQDTVIDGSLSLRGGSLLFSGKRDANTVTSRSMIMSSNGCTLTITGTLDLRAGTVVVLEKGQYRDGDILIEADSLTGNFEQLILDYDDGNPDTEYTLALHETNGQVQVMLDLDKVYEHTDGKWTISNGDLRDLLVQSNWGMFASSHAFTDALQGQRSASGAVGSKGVMVWAAGLYSHMSVSDDGILNGSDSDTMGAAMGIESMIGTRSCIGLAVGVTSTDISVSNIADEMEQEGTYIGVYGATVLSHLNATSGLTLSWSAAYGSVESSPSGAASSIEWQQDSFQLNGRLDWSSTISDRTTVNVFAGLEYFMTTSDEVAGVDSGEISNLRAELGLGITRRYSASVLYAEARLLGDVMRDDPTPSINGWSEEGTNPGTVGAGFRVGAAYDINQYWSISGNGNIEIMGDAVSAGANVGVSLKF